MLTSSEVCSASRRRGSSGVFPPALASGLPPPTCTPSQMGWTRAAGTNVADMAAGGSPRRECGLLATDTVKAPLLTTAVAQSSPWCT